MITFEAWLNFLNWRRFTEFVLWFEGARCLNFQKVSECQLDTSYFYLSFRNQFCHVVVLKVFEYHIVKIIDDNHCNEVFNSVKRTPC